MKIILRALSIVTLNFCFLFSNEGFSAESHLVNVSQPKYRGAGRCRPGEVLSGEVYHLNNGVSYCSTLKVEIDGNDYNIDVGQALFYGRGPCPQGSVLNATANSVLRGQAYCSQLSVEVDGVVILANRVRPINRGQVPSCRNDEVLPGYMTQLMNGVAICSQLKVLF